MKYLLAIVCMVVSVSLSAQTDFEWERKISKVKATVNSLGDEIFVIKPEGDGSNRYISQQLPEEYKKEGLKVTFTGMVGKIPPNFRMMGTPLKLISISVAGKEMKKFGLKKCKYVFK